MPAHKKMPKFTDEDYERLKALGGKVPQEIIALFYGVSHATFKRAIKKDKLAKEALAYGRAVAVINVAETLYKKAVEGRQPAWAFFFLKTQGGYRETNNVELTGKDGKAIETKNKLTVTIKDAREE